jgi:hypothetical protein
MSVTTAAPDGWTLQWPSLVNDEFAIRIFSNISFGTSEDWVHSTVDYCFKTLYTSGFIA